MLGGIFDRTHRYFMFQSRSMDNQRMSTPRYDIDLPTSAVPSYTHLPHCIWVAANGALPPNAEPAAAHERIVERDSGKYQRVRIVSPPSRGDPRRYSNGRD